MLAALCMLAALARATDALQDTAVPVAPTDPVDEAALTDWLDDTSYAEPWDSSPVVPTDCAPVELCDEDGEAVDDDCDGRPDRTDPDLAGVVVRTWIDEDGDGARGRTRRFGCPLPGWVTGGDVDCDDTNPGVYPGATEIVGDGLDNDCVGGDEPRPPVSCAVDNDGDGYAGSTDGTSFGTCDFPGVMPVDTPIDDCDDLDPSVHPGGTDPLGDGVDGDCNGVDGDGLLMCRIDADGDGWGREIVESDDGACDGPGRVPLAPVLDCDDTDANVHPEAAEIANDGVDNDCDGASLALLPPERGCDTSGGAAVGALVGLLVFRRIVRLNAGPRPAGRIRQGA